MRVESNSTQRRHNARLMQQDLDASGYTPLRQSFNFSDGETPAGLINGINDTFVLENVPNPAESLLLFSDKVIQLTPVDFSLVDNMIVLTTPPATSLRAWYRY